MTNDNYYGRSHAKLCRALELRNEFDSIAHDLTLPTSKRELVLTTANWFVDKGIIMNESRMRYNQALGICQEYIAISKERIQCKL